VNQQIFQTETGAEAAMVRPSGIALEESVASAISGESVAQNSGSEIAEQRLIGYERERKRLRRRLRRATLVGIGVGIGMTIANGIALLMVLGRNAAFSLPITVGMLLLGGALISGCALVAAEAGFRQRRLRSRFVSTSQTQSDARLAGPLIEMLDQPKTHPSVAASLVELLPRLSVEDAHRLSHEQLQRLCDVLCSGEREDHPLRVAILRAFARIGDGSVVTPVRRIADSPARTRRQRELKAEAQKCLPALSARTRHEAASRTLLRAANIQTSAPNTLLRPAAAASSSTADHLLRPAISSLDPD
jgi:hypothetical protein